MTTDLHRLRRAEEAFARVVELEGEARERELARVCAGDADLEREVRELLDHSARSHGFLERPALGPHFSAAAPVPPGGAAADDWLGRVVGSWRLERRLASGGMGTVYLAARSDEEFTQHVAIKVVRRGLDSEEILRRFRAERQTLAALNHPFIARLFDGGATDSGQPYLVMEYVEGTPIDRFCDRASLSIDERLRLFLRVCAAVAHAHQQLVVHRDIKPANILVQPDGTPKLLDFGIAGVIAPDQGTGKLAAPEERRLTPEYASPEQVAGRPVATTSDVYSLGVVLYELLCGSPPYRFPTRTPAEVGRVVAEADPIVPSTAVERGSAGGARDASVTSTAAATSTPVHDAATPPALAPDAEGIARARGTTRRQLRRRLAGDLDAIVLTALRKDPLERYASVERLAEDVRRHLAGLPVSARRDTFGYRAGKFVRRHALATALSAALVLLLCAGLAAVSAQARVARAQRDEAFLARDQSEAVQRFLSDMLASADPAKSGRDVTVREIVDEAARRVDAELAAQPYVRATLHGTIGRTYLALGELSAAGRELESAYEQQLALRGPRHPEVARSLNALAEHDFAAGNLDRAEQRLQDALTLFRATRGEQNADVARALSALGAVYRAQRRLDEAEAQQREALAIRRVLEPEPGASTAESLNNLSAVLMSQGRQEAAEEALREALSIRRSALGERHPLVAQTLDNLGVLLFKQKRVEEAELLFREALAREVEVLGEEHPDTAVTERNLGLLLYARGVPEEALGMIERCVATRARLYARADPRRTSAELDLADMLSQAGRWDEARPLIESCLDAVVDAGVDEQQRSAVRRRAAALFQRQGETERASELLRTTSPR